ncbi:MAG TPA: FkbM family methyltransferase [Ramlibacter sp.]|nr:FkbM family methyltransferase [Ramlibacter sp.]
MPPIESLARRIFRNLPASAQLRLRALRSAQAAPVPQENTELAAWNAIFKDVFDVAPTPAQRAALQRLAGQATGLSRQQRLRRVLAAFDQQDLPTGMSVRWSEADVQTTSVEGLSLCLDQADVSVSAPLAAGVYEQHLVSFFKGFLKPGMHVVDAGANLGLYTLLAAGLVGPQGRVWSFEPNSENCRLLLVSALRNDLANIELHPVALGNGRGHMFFTSALGSNGGLVEEGKRNLTHPSCRIVPLARLDDFAIERADLVKMDVEGAEGLLVQGATQFLARHRPTIVAEFSHEMLNRISGMPGAAFLRLFTALGYRVSVFDKLTHQPHPVADTDAFAAEFVGTGRIEDLLLSPVA